MPLAARDKLSKFKLPDQFQDLRYLANHSADLDETWYLGALQHSVTDSGVKINSFLASSLNKRSFWLKVGVYY